MTNSRKRALSALIAVGIIIGTSPPAVGAPKVVPGHPRLFLRATDVPALKKRCRETPTVKAAYGLMHGFAYGDAMQANLWVAPDELSAVLVAYLVEDRDPELLARARRHIGAFSQAEGDGWTQPRMLKALAQAYDWLHADLREDERKACAARMMDLVERMTARYRHSDYNNHVYLERGPIVYAGLVLAGDGIADAWAEEVLNGAEVLLKEHFIPTLNQLGAGGEGGWHESMSYWSFFAYELAHQLEAWRTATGEDLFSSCPGLQGAAQWMLHCTRPHDASMAPVGDINTPARWGWQETAYLPLLAARYRDGVSQHAASLVEPAHPARAWPYVLWFDPSVKLIPEDTLPLGMLFSGVGWAAMRSAWDEDAVWALFVCGDTYAGHQHADQNAFTISHRGDLAIDAGEYGAKETSFHNTIIIGTGDGQRVYGTDPRRFYGPTPPGSEFDTGEILAFEENRRFTYVVGEAGKAYGTFRDGRRQGDPPRFVRRFIFLKPGTFVVDDQVSASGGPIRWLLHAHEPPEITGHRVRIAAGDGELLCETLLPRRVRLSIHREAGGRRRRESHRIEVAPEEAQGDVRLLHVLHARWRGADSVAVSSLESAGGTLNLTVTAAEGVFRLALPPGGQTGGRISVRTRDGTALVEDRLLPAGVLPHGLDGARMLERWDSAYRRDRRAAWDTGRPSSELKKAVEGETVRPCRALVLGCGTGTNAVYLASQGFEVTAIDVAPTALRLAGKKADDAGVRVRWLLADVLAPPALEPFGFIFDRGCYHGVRSSGADAYRMMLGDLSRPGALCLIIAGNANEPPPHYGPPRIKEDEIRGDFSDSFEFEWLRETRFDTASADGKGALAWSALLRRKGGR